MSQNPDRSEAERLQSLTTLGTVSYVLHLIVAVGALVPGAQISPVLLIVALVLDLVKRPDAEGSWHASHFRWRIRTVLIAAALYVLTAPLWFFFFVPGWLAWLAISVWFLYRIIRGMVNMNKGLPMEFSA
ncbi:MAG: hypothetical protein A2Z93_05570 [Curvibacter sp. GWA2_64_110]|nr:MAG: hypothetical protein A2Z93_05570 [Curvibacter sp. GWA2_64_110]HCY15786.1 hypothetical protein [Curvibacter sp.]